MTNTPLNPDAVEAAAIAFYLSVRGTSRRAEDWEAVRGVYKQGYRNDAQAAVSAYLAAAQPVVNSEPGCSAYRKAPWPVRERPEVKP